MKFHNSFYLFPFFSKMKQRVAIAKEKLQAAEVLVVWENILTPMLLFMLHKAKLGSYLIAGYQVSLEMNSITAANIFKQDIYQANNLSLSTMWECSAEIDRGSVSTKQVLRVEIYLMDVLLYKNTWSKGLCVLTSDLIFIIQSLSFATQL